MRNAKLLLGLFCLVQTLTACSNSQFLKSMNLSVSQVNNQDYINVSTEVSMGNIALAELTIPIQDPNTGVNLGEIGMAQAADGNQTITLSLNASSITNGSTALGSTLPNGRAIPIAAGGVSGNLVGIPVLDYSRVYIGGDLKSSIIVGLALSISAFDSMSVIGNSNIFFQQTFNTSLSGVAGLFTSTSPNQSGMAIFAKYTAPAPTTVVAANAKMMSSAFANAASAPIAVSGKLAKNAVNTIVNDGMSSSNEQKVYNYMYGKKRMVRPQ